MVLQTAKAAASAANPVAAMRGSDRHASALSVTHWVPGARTRRFAPGARNVGRPPWSTARSRHRDGRDHRTQARPRRPNHFRTAREAPSRRLTYPPGASDIPARTRGDRPARPLASASRSERRGSADAPCSSRASVRPGSPDTTAFTGSSSAAGDRPYPCPPLRRTESSRQGVTAASHGCRRTTPSVWAPPGVRSSFRAGVLGWSSRHRLFDRRSLRRRTARPLGRARASAARIMRRGTARAACRVRAAARCRADPCGRWPR